MDINLYVYVYLYICAFTSASKKLWYFYAFKIL